MVTVTVCTTNKCLQITAGPNAKLQARQYMVFGVGDVWKCCRFTKKKLVISYNLDTTHYCSERRCLDILQDQIVTTSKILCLNIKWHESFGDIVVVLSPKCIYINSRLYHTNNTKQAFPFNLMPCHSFPRIAVAVCCVPSSRNWRIVTLIGFLR